MNFAVDLHIHSALSPCSDNDMTPNNIVNMALLKGLDFIAVTDHNSAENLGAVLSCAEGTGLTVVPGMEVETSEEVHLVCLFPDVASALQVQGEIYGSLPPVANREDIFGSQLVMNEKDEVAGKVGRFLLTASGYGADEIFTMVENIGGVVVPAHVDRQSYSMLSNLGSIPEGLGIRWLEVSKACDEAAFRAEHPELSGYAFVKSSDAHHLGDILERETFLDLPERSIDALLRKLRDRD